MEVHNTDDSMQVSYSHATYGDTIQPIKRRCVGNNEKLWWKEIFLSEMDYSYFIITSDKEEMMYYMDNIIIDTSSRVANNSRADGKYIPSGIQLSQMKICSLI